MSMLKPRGIPIVLEGVERRLLFTLNVIDAIQDETGQKVDELIEQLTDEEKASKTIRYLTRVLLNDEAEREKRKNPECELKPVTENEIGEMIGLDNVNEITVAVLRAYGYSLPEADDDDPNRESGRQNS